MWCLWVLMVGSILEVWTVWWVEYVLEIEAFGGFFGVSFEVPILMKKIRKNAHEFI
jgi:hypothetical protein